MNVGDLNKRVRDLGGLHVKLSLTHEVNGSSVKWTGMFTTAGSSHSEAAGGTAEFSVVSAQSPGPACRFLKDGETVDTLIDCDNILDVESLTD